MVVACLLRTNKVVAVVGMGVKPNEDTSDYTRPVRPIQQ